MEISKKTIVEGVLIGVLVLALSALGKWFLGSWQALLPYGVAWVMVIIPTAALLAAWRYFRGPPGKLSKQIENIERALNSEHLQSALASAINRSFEGERPRREELRRRLDDVTSLIGRGHSAFKASIWLDALRDDARRRLDIGWEIIHSDRDLQEKIDELQRWESDIDKWLESNPDFAGVKNQLATERRNADGYVVGGVKGVFPHGGTTPSHLPARIHALANSLDQEIRARRNQIAASLDDGAAS